MKDSFHFSDQPQPREVDTLTQFPGFHRSRISANAEHNRAWKRRAELSIYRRAPYFPEGHPCTELLKLEEEKKAREEKEKVKERERRAVEEEKRQEKLEKD